MGLKSGKKSTISDEEKIRADANSAYALNLKSLNGKKATGGNRTKHQASSFGIAIKWLIYIRRMTYKEFAEMYNGTTAQNINHLINRIDKDRYFKDILEKMCMVLGVNLDYVYSLSDEIEKIMESNRDEKTY